MKGSKIRQKFLNFFRRKNHKILPSASLIPQNDPTLLWINAGMAPLKDYFSGESTPPKRRIATVQKCIRTNDIENVGYTARHQTFFEMLGNFSFGDYFKEEAITWGYEFLTEELDLDPSRFVISIFKEDEEAFEIWNKKIEIPEDRIVRMGKEENFWEIGTGPCGPCSEIHYDRGIEFGCGEDCELGCECGRYLEIWNLVFSQYNKTEAGDYVELPQKNIDTGAGFERLASLLQGTPTNFETDLFKPIIDYVTEHCEAEYGASEKTDTALKVIADHSRSVTFAIGDGALPSNEGRGYVVRRLLRRAVRYARELELEIPFLHQIVPVIVDMMGDHYSTIRKQKKQIKKIIKQEELKFQKTLAQGMEILEEIIAELKAEEKTEIPGEKVFTLYDTYGFPKELTEEIARERGFTIDEAGYEAAMEKQRARAREAREDHDRDHNKVELFKSIRNCTENVEFIGYNNYKAKAEIVSLVQGEAEVEKVEAGEKAELVLAKTPFYAESGGQIGDQGIIASDKGEAEVQDTQEIAEIVVHQIEVTEGKLVVGEQVQVSVDYELRKAAARNHTATHLLHQALREVLGDHVSQAGSLVTSDRLRFDFTHFESLTEAEREEIETRVNNQILANLPVTTEEMSLEAAKEAGVTALFGEKYDDQVRVVEIGDYSSELCGGTHVEAAGEIGLFKIMNESGIASGTRRLECVTGKGALEYVNQQEGVISTLAVKLKANPGEVIDKVDKLQERIKELESEVANLKDKLAISQTEEMLAGAEEINGIKTVIEKVNGLDEAGLRKMGDKLKAELESGIIILGSKLAEKVLFVAMVTEDLVEQDYHAGEIIGEAAQIAGGGGGGRPDMAQAGGSQPEQTTAALNKAREIISGDSE